MCGTRRRSRPQPRQSPCHVDAAHVGMDAGVGGEGGCGSGAGGTASESSGAGSRRPIACIVLGMAGSGKTTLMHRLNTHLHEVGTPYYLVNLDPAVADTPFGANIDIRDTVNYREVMKQYQLGPNGGILTSLNLFATRFDEVLKLVAARAQESRYVLFDTPGQIEIFTWSASGAIITEALASAMPTVVVYVVDTPRSAHAVTFMSNMLYACSILYKTKLPLLLAFNKIDVSPHGPLLEWMTDLEAFQAALQSERSYMGTLATSMALMLEEFYKSLDVVGVSAMTGEGMAGFFAAVSRATAAPRAQLPHHVRPHAPRHVLQLDRAAVEYDKTYGAELEQRRAKAAEAEAARQRRATDALAADGCAEQPVEPMAEDGPGGGASGMGGRFGRMRLGAGEWVGDAEGGGEEYEEGGASYTAADEEWAYEVPDPAGEREELESLRRFMAKQHAGPGANAE